MAVRVQQVERRQHAYSSVADTEDFAALRGRYLRRTGGSAVAAVVWFALFVAAALAAPGFMAAHLLGHVSVGVVFAVLQVVAVFVVVGLATRFGRGQDATAEGLTRKYRKERRRG